MNQLATQQERLPMDSVGISTGSAGAKIAPQNLAEVVKFAEVMCRADIALPKHLRGNAGACMAVALQALEWQLSPFAVASKSYAVNGAIAYEAQLIAAVVNTRSGIKGRLRYSYDGTGNDLTCTVTGILDDEECSYTTPTIGSITTKNSPLWKSDPQQQLGYFAARSWARRHCPEVILGVYDRDEAEQFRGPDHAKDVTPSVMDRLKAQNATQETQGEREGFSRSFIADQTDERHDALTGEIIDNQNTDERGPANEASSVADEVPPPSSQEDGGEVSPPSASSPSSSLSDETRQHLMDFARKGLRTLGEDLDNAGKLSAIDDMIANYRDAIPESDWSKLSTIKVSIQAVLAGKRTVDQARSFVATDLLDCSPAEIGG
ncbi:recombinase RecT [Shinella zoogloeoides]